jgi:flavin-dependent dehydrogenase
MGLAVGPRIGATTLVVGDAGGSINPFNGEGIAYGYESGRLAAASLGEALSGDGFDALVRYEARLEDGYGLYYRVARAFAGRDRAGRGRLPSPGRHRPDASRHGLIAACSDATLVGKAVSIPGRSAAGPTYLLTARPIRPDTPV